MVKTLHISQTIMLSFDYSENLLIPSLIETPGIFYFKTRRKIDIFGINNESSNTQLNFLIDEPFKIQKGPNSVISMLDSYLARYVPDGTSLILYADNCPGQNKNQTMIAYLSYLVKILKRFPCVELHYLISDHTKFSPDRNFGHIKKNVRSSNCFSILELIGDDGLIKRSGGRNDVITYKDPNSLITMFQWKDWKKFLSKKFLPCNGIRNWHKIKILPNNDDICVADYEDEDLRMIKILKTNVNLDESPDIIQPNGLSEDRSIDLEFFKDYVENSHKDFVSRSY
jgi:hypothetical protein